jgi:hypothetical protein
MRFFICILFVLSRQAKEKKVGLCSMSLMAPLGNKNPAGFPLFSLGRTPRQFLTLGRMLPSFGSPKAHVAATLTSPIPRVTPSPPPDSWQRRPELSPPRRDLSLLAAMPPPRPLHHASTPLPPLHHAVAAPQRLPWRPCPLHHRRLDVPYSLGAREIGGTSMTVTPWNFQFQDVNRKNN